MAGTGANALFKRVREITATLHDSGAEDRNQKTARNTFQAIDEEGRRQLERFGNRDPNHHRPDPEHSAFGNQLSYLHNEFNFDVAIPLGDIALVTHTSFIPVFPPKYTRKARDADLPQFVAIRPELVSESLVERLLTLRAKAIHEADGRYEEETFFGGKDDIIKSVDRFHSFDQPVITTMRSIERLNDFIHRSFLESGEPEVAEAARRAAAANELRDREVASHGMSSRLSMHRNFALRCSASGSSKWRLGWERHHSHYQTLVAVEHSHAALVPGSRISEAERATVPTLAALVDDLSEPNDQQQILLDRTALDALPEDWPQFLYGRYLQGANYLLLPAAMLFEPSHLRKCEHAGLDFGTTAEPWHDLTDRVLRLCEVPHQYGHRVNLSLEQFKEMWAKARGDNVKLRPASELALRLLRPMINILFANKTESRFEFVMFGAAGGAAIIVSDVRNFGTSARRPLMSATLILDLGMNQYERGRLLKHLTEFSTQRFLSLHTLGSFRFFNDVLDVLSEKLIDATNTWMDNGADTHDSQATLAKDGRFIASLQDLTTNLTLLNSLVNGGIVVHGTAVEASRERVTSHIDGIGHYPLPGFMGMTEFLDRRYFKSVRTIGAVSRRYQLLRERIAQLSSLVEAKVGIVQDGRHLEEAAKQSSLLSKADSLTKWGIAYYGVQVVSYALIGLYFLVSLIKTVWSPPDTFHEGTEALIYLVSLIVLPFLLYQLAKDTQYPKARVVAKIILVVLPLVVLIIGLRYFGAFEPIRAWLGFP